MATQSFKDLIVWQKARDLSVEVYKTCKNVNDYGYKDQIQRAVVSIMNNIAEGYARRSDNSLKYFLSISKGSAAEVESMIFLGTQLGYISQQSEKSLIENTQEVSKLITGLHRKL